MYLCKLLPVVFLLFAGCHAPPTDILTGQPDAPLPDYKFKYGDVVSFKLEFYGRCTGQIKQEPLYASNCHDVNNPKKGYVYIFGSYNCGGYFISGQYTTRCEDELKLVKRGNRDN